MKITVKMVSRSRSSQQWSASEQELLPPELAPSAPSDSPAEKVEHLITDQKAMEDYLWTRDYVDIMSEFSAKYTPEEFLELASRVKPRLYSIASSHDAHPGLVELTVGIVRFSYHGRDRGGLCTQFMADEIGIGQQRVGVFMFSCHQQNHSFYLKTKVLISSWSDQVPESHHLELLWSKGFSMAVMVVIG